MHDALLAQYVHSSSMSSGLDAASELVKVRHVCVSPLFVQIGGVGRKHESVAVGVDAHQLELFVGLGAQALVGGHPQDGGWQRRNHSRMMPEIVRALPTPVPSPMAKTPDAESASTATHTVSACRSRAARHAPAGPVQCGEDMGVWASVTDSQTCTGCGA